MNKEIFENIDPKLLAKFKEYHLQNPMVYAEFSRNAKLMLTKTGRKKYSAWTIINKIRWDHDIRTTGDVFAINNDFIALYARLMIYHHPEFADFFELRKMKPADRRSSDEERYRRTNVAKR